jgi:5-deoxy-glucuronate isomerase
MISGRERLFRPGDGRVILSVEPEDMGWGSLGFSVYRLAAGEEVAIDTGQREAAVVPISGRFVVECVECSYELARAGVFCESAGLLYLPPGTAATLVAERGGEVAVGSAPARGEYPARLIDPADMLVELRGGGPARRQVNHALVPPLPAERLIVYEVYLPSGSWAGWPPHRHDGVDESPYLEETYFFKFDRPGGFGFHRNYDRAGYDETFTAHDRDCVAVPGGFHVTASSPGANMWILNFLAGELEGEDRARPPVFDPETTWILDDWSAGRMALPLGGRAA